MKNKYQACKDFIHKRIANSDVLISVGAKVADFNGYVELNESAAVLWKALQTPCEIHELEKIFEETYGISHEAAAADVKEFMDLLIEHDMVVVS